MKCFGDGCSRKHDCFKWIGNQNFWDKNKVYTIENLATFGSASIGVDGIKENFWCGSQGNYAMFEPIPTATLSKTETVGTNEEISAVGKDTDVPCQS